MPSPSRHHDATLKVSGVKVFDGTDEAIGKIYRGQQLVLFGRYDRGGKATITLKATLTGQDKTYTTTVHFPDVDTRNPEVERLWALNRVEALEMLQLRGRLPAREAEQAIRQLGVTYQLVTDQTSMIATACERLDRRRFLAGVLLSALLIPLATWCLMPHLASYRGLSGIDSALFALLGVALLREVSATSIRAAAAGALLALAAKVAYQRLTGSTVFVHTDGTAVVAVPLAHVIGAMVGAGVGAWGSVIESALFTNPPRVRRRAHPPGCPSS